MMKAMLLAAGRGKRLRPYTDHTPKPLLPVAGKPLIVHHIERLASVGVSQLVINHAHLGQAIEDTLGDGQHWGVEIRYSPEPTGGLETGGGLVRALSLLGERAFIAVNADVLTDYDFTPLLSLQPQRAHWVMVDNPAHNPDGDFAIHDSKLSRKTDDNIGKTFSGIAVYNPAWLAQYSAAVWSITAAIRQHLEPPCIDASLYQGYWSDVGTEQRWRQAELDWANLHQHND
jgi:MurNAc alpha-1-phosphate uridylyltransferase